MIDDRQFLITKEIVPKEHWKNILMRNGFTLNYHKDLMVSTNNDYSAVLLGYAWSVIPNQDTPQQIIMNYTTSTLTETIFNDEESWCGRYILIVGNRLFLDAMGLLGVFYTGGGISSSIRLLCEFCGLQVKFPNIKHDGHPDFVPGIETGYDNIKRLLPSQVLNLGIMNFEIRPLLPHGIIDMEKENGRIQEFINRYTQSLNNMSKLFSGYDYYFCMTGGRDSRTVLAMLENTDIPYKAFTAEHENISKGDIYIPRMLAKVLGRRYQYIKRRKSDFNQQRYDDFKKHTGGFSVDEDWNFHAYRQYAQLPPRTIILRGGGFETTALYYKAIYCKDESFNIRKIYCDMDANPEFERSITEYLEYVENDTVNKKVNINIFDRIYWELSDGCWLSSVEQSFDMMDNIISVQTFNCRLFMSYLLGFDEKKREQKMHQEQLIETACPVLGTIPYDYDNYKNYYPMIPKLKKRIRDKLYLIMQNIKGDN